jgi:hypothetical protein
MKYTTAAILALTTAFVSTAPTSTDNSESVCRGLTRGLTSEKCNAAYNHCFYVALSSDDGLCIPKRRKICGRPTDPPCSENEICAFDEGAEIGFCVLPL